MKKTVKLQINNIRVRYKAGERADYEAEAIHKAASLVNRITSQNPANVQISKKSIDARREISFVYTVTAEIEAGGKSVSHPDVKLCSEAKLDVKYGEKKLTSRPLIVGFGPAGMFAGLLLAEHGYEPIILERGQSVDERVAAVDRFTKYGILDSESNIQFGAGGAGTFSDGKLTTRINDSTIAYVLSVLHSLGAPDDILYKAKPHIGTDILREVVKNADARIRSLGGEILYNTKAEKITSSSLSACGEKYDFDALVLALGHSARDTYSELIGSGFSVEPKPYSVGVRIEHKQADIDKALFREYAGDPTLGRGEYQLSYREGGRGCYTFCMCPGGVVVPSASEDGGVVTNGMSSYKRDGENANSAVCVSVDPADYGSTPTGAIEFQRKLERLAYTEGGGDYTAPYQLVGDFLGKKSGGKYSEIKPTYRDGCVREADLHAILPEFVTDMLERGISDFGRRIKGFDAPNVPLTGVETRTSSPVRIMRNEDCTAVGYEKIYPCGEGAGYAGGIVSAAVDGLRIAQKIIAKYAPINR